MKLKGIRRQVTDEKGEPIKCPVCHYDFHYILGAGLTPTGISPENIKFECGNCGIKFYEFASTNYVSGGEVK